MFTLTIPDLAVGMVVITPNTVTPHLTEDKRYVILSLDGDDWITIQDDLGEERSFQSHLFIEADVYYSMIMWLSIMRLFDMSPKDM
jgi:hypothetical protein